MATLLNAGETLALLGHGMESSEGKGSGEASKRLVAEYSVQVAIDG